MECGHGAAIVRASLAVAACSDFISILFKFKTDFSHGFV